MKRIAFAAVLGLLLSGCAVEYAKRMPFPEAEFAKLSRPGSDGKAIVRGQAFLMTRGGDVKKGAGRSVRLAPWSSYGQQEVQACSLQGKIYPPEDARYDDYSRFVTADAEGKFTFSNVPPGRYVVATTVTWEVPDLYSVVPHTEGGCIAKPVVLTGAEEVEVVLTR